ncbi:MAG: hypothetical protein NTW38_04815 [Candidatus Aminicenantes bacterium]|nr:hypothetical protein [Candidatus Aminicenantes bacterium]
MHESQDKKSAATDADIEAVVRRESEEALCRFPSGDFASRLKTRLKAPLPRQRFLLFRKPVFAPALGVLVAATAAIFLLLRAPNDGDVRVEAGFRRMTESLAASDAFRVGGLRVVSCKPDEGRSADSFTSALFRAATGSDAGSASESAAPAEGGAPLRPLFSPDERFKILYGDQAILRVLTKFTTQKEV